MDNSAYINKFIEKISSTALLHQKRYKVTCVYKALLTITFQNNIRDWPYWTQNGLNSFSLWSCKEINHFTMTQFLCINEISFTPWVSNVNIFYTMKVKCKTLITTFFQVVLFISFHYKILRKHYIIVKRNPLKNDWLSFINFYLSLYSIKNYLHKHYIIVKKTLQNIDDYFFQLLLVILLH